ncbi:MAG: inorganic diphosphatase [Candidatus Aenigmarchaeota archaeon]|nr:inorganic diphosphatase [Candidatus Aenigmarchaeota archaeon]
MDMKKDVPLGRKSPDIVNVIVEVPLGSHDKIEYDEELHVFKVDRTLYSRLTYPGNYGFLPQTLAGDGDPLDCIILANWPLYPGVAVAVRPVGMLVTKDEKGEDEKLLGVPDKDPRFSGIKDIGDVAEHTKSEIAHFFEQYKALEPGKWVKVTGWQNAADAKQLITEAHAAFRKH